MIKVNGHTVPITIFPDNTSQVWKLADFMLASGRNVEVQWDFTHEGEMMQLAQLKCLFDSNHVSASLHLSYLPYGRQDKDVSNETTFALTVFADMINGMKFSSVTIMDPHSIRALQLIKNSVAVYPTAQVQQIFSEHSDLVCYPDHGAHSKYQDIYPNLPFIYGEKVRDQVSGRINSYKVIGSPLGKRIMIIDDICDGGQTFKLLAQELLSAGALSVVLFVTHGIFSNGTQSLFASGITKIYTKTGEIGHRHKSMQF